MDHSHVVKRKGHKEIYDSHKVHTSCIRACRDANIHGALAEKICREATDRLTRWIADKNTVDSRDIFNELSRALRELNQKAAFMYETHRDIS